MNIFKKNKISALICTAAITTSLTATALDRIPVKFIVGAQSHSGLEAVASTTEMDTGIVQLNNYFNELGLEFFRDEIVYITNSDVSGINNDDWNTDNEEDIRPWFEYGSMNIIVVGDMDGVAGHAYWHDEQTDVIEVEPERLLTSTIAHEVGHNLSLKHTYQNWDDATIAEMEGPNGYKYGDNVIDTAVDPKDRDSFNNCVWQGSQVDSEGGAYAPDGFNVMGKGQNECRNRFSSEQKQRMERVIQTYKFHLFDKYGANQNPSCSNSTKVTSFPTYEGFDYEETVSDTPWVQDVFNDDDFNWKIGVKTSSSITGASASQAGHNFIHLDAGHEFLSAGAQVNLLSPCYDLTNKNMAEVDFYYQMYGGDIGKLSLEVTIDNGENWLELWSKEGQQHTSGESWSKASVNLDSYLNKSIQLRLKGEVIGGSKGDLSIDTITFRTAIIGDKPIITSQQNLVINEDQSLTLDVADFTFADEVSVDSLTISSGENYQVNGQTIIPGYNFNGTLSLAVSAYNNGSESEPFITTIIVNPVNDLPTAIDDRISVTQDSKNNIIDVISNDIDVDHDSLELKQIDYDGSSSIALSANKVVYTPVNGFSGSENLTYVIDDGNGGLATGNLIITTTANMDHRNNPTQPSGGSFYYSLLFLIVFTRLTRLTHV
jgi:hypothetical protein